MAHRERRPDRRYGGAVIDWIEAHAQFLMLVGGFLMTVASAFVTKAVAQAKPTMEGIVDRKLKEHERKEFENHDLIERRLTSFETRLDTVTGEVSRMGGYLEAIAIGNGNRRRREDDE